MKKNALSKWGIYRFVNKRISNKSSIGAIVEDCGDVLTENINKLIKLMHLTSTLLLLVSLMMELPHVLIMCL